MAGAAGAQQTQTQIKSTGDGRAVEATKLIDDVSAGTGLITIARQTRGGLDAPGDGETTQVSLALSDLLGATAAQAAPALTREVTLDPAATRARSTSTSASAAGLG